jgi:hypothetical protein
MRRCLPQFVFAAAMSLSFPALAQNNNCPPGSWFCADAEVKVPGPERPAAPTLPQPERRRVQVQEEEPDGPPSAAPTQGPPPVVVYQPGPPAHPPVVIVSPGYRHRRYLPPPPPPLRPRWRPEWGLNLRVEGVVFGHARGGADNMGMGGIGSSLRFRPIPHLAFEAGFDFLAGNDFNGFERQEIPITLGGILYLNPRNRVQVYLTGGMHFSHANVHSDRSSRLLQRDSDGGYSAEYTYFGGQGGAGLEFRISRRVAVNIDGIGFLRRRTDDGPRPEFIDPEHNRVTNTSAGALVRGGLTFWW